MDKNSKEPGQAKEYRCPCCKRLLGKGNLVFFETKCPKCGRIVQLKG